MNSKQDDALPRGLTAEAEEQRKRFEKQYREFLMRSREVSLSILVWGQSPASQSRVAKKRVEIRDELQRLGHHAVFSEDLPNIEGFSEKSKEFAQAQAADLVMILLEDSPGALAETHDFCNHPEIAPKLTVMVPSKYRGGYSAKGAVMDFDAAFGGVFWYDDDDIDACHLCGRAVQRAEAVRNILYRHGDRR